MNKIIAGILLTTSLYTYNMSYADSITDNGMIHLKSPHSVSQTLDRLEAILNKKGMPIFKRISHSKAARKNNLTLRDTELLIFGNPKIGTKLMQCAQTVAIDLPQKALAYEDSKGQTWVSYNDPAYLRQRHNIGGCGAVIDKISGALAGMLQASIQP